MAEALAAAFRRRLTAPWTERNGKFSVLKAVVFAAVLAPAADFSIRYFQGVLEASLWKILIRDSGLWAIRFLMLTLAVTPLRRILAWPRLGSVRRTLGVAALVYTSVHLVAFAADQAFDFAVIATELAFRLYLAVGTLAFLIMVPLGLTSTDAMVRRLGGARWRRLHQLVYLAGFLSVLHFFLLLLKLITDEATIWAGLFVWMMAYRVVAAWVGAPNLAWNAALVLAAGLGTMAIEAAFFLFLSDLDPMQVLSANWTFQAGVRPGWEVALIVLALLVAGRARRWLQSRPRVGDPQGPV